MEIHTSRFGVIEIEEDQVIHIPSGMIGFPEDRRFVLLKHQKGSPFLWLQSLDHPSLAFVLIDPHLFKPDYEIRINPEDTAELELNHTPKGIQTLVVVNISNTNSINIYANLLAPLVINTKRRLAKQVILYESPYSHQHAIPLIEADESYLNE